MTADLVITEDMLLQMAKTYERLEESIRDLPEELPLDVDAGIATAIIMDMLGVLDYSGTAFAQNCNTCSTNLRRLVNQHKENDEEVTQHLNALNEQMK